MTAIPHPSQAGSVAHEAHGAEHPHEISFFKKYIFSTDHKVIGIQFLLLGLTFFVIGGLEAMLVRWQLGWPGRPVPVFGAFLKAIGVWTTESLPDDWYTATFTMHASIMIFFVIIPLLVGTFGNYLIPLKIGAADMAFPFMNGLAFWSAFPAGTIMVASFFLNGGPAAAGWTSYPPLSALFLGHGPENVWPAFGVVMLYLASVLCLLYLCAYYVTTRRTGSLIWGICALAIVYGALLFTHSPAYVLGATPTRVVLEFLILCGFLVAAFLIGDRMSRITLSVILSAIAAVYIGRGAQHIAFDGQSAWFLSLFILGFSSILGAVNYISTIVKLRCPGMTMFRMPLSVWALFITSILVLLATPVLAATLLLNLLDHHRVSSFFQPYNWVVANVPQSNSGGGYAILHQHLFWFYSHPAVYIMILPAMGMVSDIIAVFSRKPIFGYRPMVYAIAGIAFLGFIVWAHHMFQSGMNPTLGTTFAISTMFIAVPSAIKTFNWLGTVWGGNIRFTAAMLNALAFVAMFVIGGLSGIFMASTAVDVHIHDTYFIVAHIHYVLFGGTMFGIFGSIYFWYPKMFGRMMNETLGKIHFILSFIAFNCTFFPMHILGVGGVARRYADHTGIASFAKYQPMNQFISVSAFVLGIAQLPFIINFIGSWVWGPKASRNPWEATTLEWETESPPPHGNFTKVPVVHHGPYEYSSPLVEEDWLAQTRFVEGADKLVVKH